MYSGTMLAQDLQNGVIQDKVQSTQDTAQSYAMYLPTSYSESRKWPIVYVFEPAARGSLPVEMYHEVAEELGFILVCSNNSRNGDWNIGFDAADAIFLDTQNRLSIDSRQVFTMGFSGGSRLALSIAELTRRIRGVIGVGAAQPIRREYMMNKNSNFLYAGLVGNRDMNYQEHKQFVETLNSWNKSNLLLISELDHQWAPASDFKIAMTWMFNQVNPEMERDLSSLVQDKIAAYTDSVEVIDILRLAHSMRALDPDFPADPMDKKLLKEEEKLYKKEVDYRLQLGDSLNVAIEDYKSTGTRRWVINTIGSFQKRREKSKSLSSYLMYSRVLDYMRAMSIESGFRFLNQQEYERVKVCVDVWSSYADNPGIKYWWYAKVNGLQQHKEECLEYLELLAQEGFSDLELLGGEPAFDFVRTTTEFKDILDKIESN